MPTESTTVAVKRLYDHGWSVTFEGRAVKYFTTSYASPMPWWAPGVGRKRTSQVTVTPTREQLESLNVGISGPQAERAGVHAVIDTADRRAVCGRRVSVLTDWPWLELNRDPGALETHGSSLLVRFIDGLPICETCKKLTRV
jgi:hypothetical protein